MKSVDLIRLAMQSPNGRVAITYPGGPEIPAEVMAQLNQFTADVLAGKAEQHRVCRCGKCGKTIAKNQGH